jgi:hypothetical protein
MRRTLIVLGLALAAPILTAAPALAATGHHGKADQPIVSGHKANHHPTCGGTCTPKPVPPAGGWPCQKTTSCKPPKTHCRPPHHHHPKPPTTPPTHVTPKPPVVIHHDPAPKPAAPSTPTTVPQLAYTGAQPGTLKVAGGGALALVGGSALLALTRRPKAVADAIRAELDQ